jgi:hypothetical protein
MPGVLIPSPRCIFLIQHGRKLEVRIEDSDRSRQIDTKVGGENEGQGRDRAGFFDMDGLRVFLLRRTQDEARF